MRSANHYSRFSVSASVLAISAVYAVPAFAQTQTQQEQAQQQNAAVDCSTISDAAQRATCLQTQGQNAPASEGAPAAGTIVVTGSRIPKPNFDTVQPSTVLNSQAIEERGFVNAADALNELPQFGVPGSSPVGAAQGGAFGSGQSFVNFLGLGSQRTLVLINGRRFVSSNSASIFGPAAAGEQVDLGLINTKLIDRIETIAIGGAPIYGSDAIAGTINIILKHDYEGIDLDAQDGIAQRGYNHNYRFRALAGKNFLDGRGNITASAEYNKSKGFTWNDNALLRNNQFYAECNPGSQYSQCLYPDGPRVVATPEGGAPLVFDLFGLSPLQLQQFGLPAPIGPTTANGTPLIFGPDGTLIPQDAGVNPGGADNFSFFSSGGNGFAYIRQTSNALTDIERYNANLIGHYDITDNIRFFAEGWYSHTKGTNLATQPEYNTAAFGTPAGEPGGNIILSINNPFLSPEERAAIVNAINTGFSDQNLSGIPQDYFYLSRANTDLTSGRATSTDNIYRVVAGLNGKFNALAGQWNWEVVGNRGIAKSRGHTTNVNTQNFNNAVGAITADNPNGVPCLAGLENSVFPTLSSTCSPLDLFGSGRPTQAAIDYVLSNVDRHATNKQFVFTADVNGPIAKLPGGDLSIAFGYEHRAESVFDDPGAFLHGPDPDPTVDENQDGDPTNDVISYGQNTPSLPVKGKFHTNEIFAELDGDIVSPSNDIPMIHSLDFQAAARYVKHSIAGGALTWTVGSRYAPVRDISFRGNFTHAIRSPAIQETSVPTTGFFGFATDPCDRANLSQGPDPATRQANCLAAGIPADFQSNAGSASFLQQTGGNPDLKNETSNAFSVGGVLTPSFIPRLNLSVDYISVKLKNAISPFTATDVLNACYDAPDTASNPFCGLITRNPPTAGANANQISFIKTSFFNAAELQYRGIVAALDYKFKTPFLGASSTLDLSGSYQHLFKLTRVAFAGSAPVHNQGTMGYPHDSFSATVNYLNGPVSLFTNFNFTGPVEQLPDETKNFREHQRVGSFLYINSGFNIAVDHGRFRFFGDVDNVFDRKPPTAAIATFGGGGSTVYFPGILGRYFRFGAGVHF